MNTPSPSAPSSSTTSSVTGHPTLRSLLPLLAVGVLGGLFLFAAVPRITHSWPKLVDRADQLCRVPHGPFTTLPKEAPAREFAGLNAR